MNDLIALLNEEACNTIVGDDEHKGQFVERVAKPHYILQDWEEEVVKRFLSST